MEYKNKLDKYVPMIYMVILLSMMYSFIISGFYMGLYYYTLVDFMFILAAAIGIMGLVFMNMALQITKRLKC